MVADTCPGSDKFTPLSLSRRSTSGEGKSSDRGLQPLREARIWRPASTSEAAMKVKVSPSPPSQA